MDNTEQAARVDAADPAVHIGIAPLSAQITGIRTIDARFSVPKGAAAHAGPVYSYAVTHLKTGDATTGVGLALTRGGGNDQVCAVIEAIGKRLVGRDIEELMAEFGTHFRAIADDPQYRWLGPHKGVVHLALASLTNACFDLWAKSREVPLWRLLLDLTPEQLVATLDLSYVEDVLDRAQALAILAGATEGRSDRCGILDAGYPGYDTSVGWPGLTDDTLRRKAKLAVAGGFGAIKLEVGSPELEGDIRRAALVRSVVGNSISIMLDAGQSWRVPEAVVAAAQFADMNPFWIEEPTHPDDVLGHALIAREIAPLKVATGRLIPNRVLFKQLLQVDALEFVRADAARLGGVSEFLTVSLLAKKFGKQVAPHAGDMGQIHQHLALFNHIALGHDVVFLEHTPHLRGHFLHPAIVEDGVYWTPEEPGAASDLILE